MWTDPVSKQTFTDEELIARLSASAPGIVLLQGPTGCGKTRLLRALCSTMNVQDAILTKEQVVDTVLDTIIYRKPDLVKKTEGMPLVCLDDIDLVRGRDSTQEELNVLLRRISTRSLVILSGIDCTERISAMTQLCQTQYIWKEETTESVPLWRRCWTLFLGMLYISAFTFGGGFVIVSLMKKRFVDELAWLDEEEMLDMTAIAQTAPGPIAVNAAILVGRRVAGAAGLAAAVLGTILPPMVILSLISLAYNAFASNEWVRAVLRGMQAGAAAVVADVAISLGQKTAKGRDPLAIGLMLAAFLAVYVGRVNVVLVILVTGLIGAGRALWRKKVGA